MGEFEIVKGKEPPRLSNPGRGGKYPWRSCEVGGAFFVPSADGASKRAEKSMTQMNLRVGFYEMGTWKFISRRGNGPSTAVSGVDVPGRWFYKIERKVGVG